MAQDKTTPIVILGGLAALFWYSRSKAAPMEPAKQPVKEPVKEPRDEAAYNAGFVDGGADAALSMNEADRNLGTATIAKTPKIALSPKGTDRGDGYQDGFVKSVKNYAAAGFRIEGTSDDLFSGNAKVVRDKVTSYDSGRYDGENDAVDALSDFDPEKATPAWTNRFREDMKGTPAEKGYRDGYAAVLADNKPPFQLVGDLLSGSAEIKLPASA